MMYSGARIVATVLNDKKLNPQWYAECKQMADRIITMRTALTGAQSSTVLLVLVLQLY